MTEKATVTDPRKLTDTIFLAMEDKARLPFKSLVVLGVLAGVYIGLGGLVATIALAGATGLPYGIGQISAGVAFSVGLALVLIAGAELFTGNTLMAGPVAVKRLSPAEASHALAVVYFSNFVGSLLLVVLVALTGVHDAGDGAVGRSAIDLGNSKTGNAFIATLASGILANMLVCLAVWLAYAGSTVTEKIVGLIFPIATFVAAGLEHSVANMYLLPYAYFVQFTFEDAPAWISLGDIVFNLVPATIGNIIGGSIVAVAYGCVFQGVK
ncbi:formate/nitrite transporter family protein [Mesorhizobium sp. SB112]|uniref:formate/nitrite transporter family protein n=1 Tax=Mesorhizobium sp. SB112 TaxID=3151853 RepID=UPI00326462B9